MDWRKPWKNSKEQFIQEKPQQQEGRGFSEGGMGQKGASAIFSEIGEAKRSRRLFFLIIAHAGEH